MIFYDTHNTLHIYPRPAPTFAIFTLHSPKLNHLIWNYFGYQCSRGSSI